MTSFWAETTTDRSLSLKSASSLVFSSSLATGISILDHRTILRPTNQLNGQRTNLGFFAAAEDGLVLDLLLDGHQAMNQGFGTRRTAGDVNIHRDEGIDPLHYRIGIVVIGAARDGAASHG